MAAYSLAFFAGVIHTGVAIGTAIALGSEPIWAGLLQAALHRQAPTAAWWLGTAVAISDGALLAVGGGGLTYSATGTLLCVAAGLSYALYALLNKHMVASAPASSITLGAFAVAAFVSLPTAALQTGMPSFTTGELLAAAYTGCITAGSGYLLFSQALRHIAPATWVTLTLTEPVVAYALAALLLDGPTGAASLAGVALVVGGVLGGCTLSLRQSDGRQACRGHKM